MKSVAQTLVDWLKLEGVEVIFGIPGVHTIELYRALAGSGIRHVTPRHEASAGFMADGYARVSGRFGVALVITGPGVTNILTPMAQARADSVPILVISGVNRRDTLGKGLGYLHELPDQRAVTRVLGPALHLEDPHALPGLLAHAGRALTTGRGGPVHLEIPLDLMAAKSPPATALAMPVVTPSDPAKARARLRQSKRPLILAGGGCAKAGPQLQALAEALGAPVVLTANARGLMHAHPLAVPASPSLGPIRELIRGADQLLVVGSELGPTDYDMYATGQMPDLSGMIRIDIDGAQLARHFAALTLQGDAATILPRLHPLAAAPDGAERAAAARQAAFAALEPDYQDETRLLQALRDAVPEAIFVGDSTQIAYAGNLYYSHDRVGGWFNAATGYGALGYGIGAAVGAALAAPGTRVICLTGDGGLMFHPGELRTARDEGLDVTFVVFNNEGYGEIALAMKEAGAEVIGCTPTAPDMEALATAMGLPFARGTDADLPALVASGKGPRLIEITRKNVKDL
ncbi:5-guanidino-2-oxopentanoate decarboxylase [Pararhodobacter zhoushanensis]|uniref:5-guanidino-2-oxopentanoate decarboxylase n=1 Tax=Pararhodobacter zhoushanensis TaxID=2479545 RepID=A0ABT3H108_9RHOB|nr:5-guanidino-2-oxopentanoate decarboxylase [Pararhodobacter zhoushanensis]MCW1933471.1 5-guanidino-2-oxopentanoate decarboxylase [Pararhodobacter zhoushanensis]